MKVFAFQIALAFLSVALPSGPLSLPRAQAAPLSQFLQDTPAPAVQTYKTTASGPLTLAAFYPNGWKPTDQRPLIVFIHGGAWIAGDDKVFYPHARYFASRGAVAVSLNYRLAQETGPGLPGCLTDCKSAMRFLRTHAGTLGIDPKRVAVFGDSAGGHLAAALGTCAGFDDPQDNVKLSAVPNAMILCNPILDLTEGTWIKYAIGGPLIHRGNLQASDLQPTEAQAKLARALSPQFQITHGQPPALLMHGTDDHVVNPQQAQAFADADKKAGNRCDLIWMEGSRHAFVVPHYTAPEPVVVAAIRHADEFLGSLGWLKGPPTLVTSDPPAWSSGH